MIGYDVSEYQNLPASWYNGKDLVVCKASEGITKQDTTFRGKFQSATQAKRRGAYHFAHPGHNGAVPEANHFADVALASGFSPGRDVWALDIEVEAGTPEWALAFVLVAVARLGRLGLLYTYGSYLAGPLRNDHRLASIPLWIANYASNDGAVHPVSTPWPWLLHQYTSLGGPGHTGLDVSIGGDAAWQTFLGAPAPVAAAPPAPAPAPAAPAAHDLPEDSVKDDLVHVTSGPLGISEADSKDFGFGVRTFQVSLNAKGVDTLGLDVSGEAVGNRVHVTVTGLRTGHEVDVQVWAAP